MREASTIRMVTPAPGPKWLSRKLETAILILLLAGQVAFLAGVAARQSPAGDERTYYLYAHRILFEGSFFRDDNAMFNSKMPGQTINVLPQYLGEKLKLWPFTMISRAVGPVEPKAPHQAYLFWARLAPIVLLAPLAGLLFYLWGRRLYGPLPGLILLLVLILSPNLTASLSLIISDGWMALGFMAALYFCRRYAARPSWGRLVLAGIFLGLAQLIKNTAVLLALVVPLAWFLESWPQTQDDLAQRRWRTLARRGGGGLGVLAAWLVIGLGVINTGFGWQGFGAALADIKPVSAALRDLPSFLLNLPLPLPLEFVNGVDQVLFDDQNSMTIGLVYLKGLARHMGWAGYYFQGLLWKLPLALLHIFGLALLLRWRRMATPDDAWLVVPVVVVLLRLSFSNTVQLGIKYVLIILPLMILFSGRLFLPTASRWAVAQKIGKGLFVVWLAFSTLSHYPHYISYFNETVAPTEKYRYLAAYDLSAGQGWDEADKWAKAHYSGLVPNDPNPKPGPILVSGGALLALHGEDRWRVLRESYRPVMNVAGEYFLFQADDLTPRLWTYYPGGRD